MKKSDKINRKDLLSYTMFTAINLNNKNKENKNINRCVGSANLDINNYYYQIVISLNITTYLFIN